MPQPQPDLITDLYKHLQHALGHINRAEFEYQRGDTEAGGMWLGDSRRSLGAAALLLSDVPDAEGWSKLLDTVLTDPNATPAAIAERGGIHVPTSE